MNPLSALRVFVRIVDRGSMTAAAADLGISQPAVSKILRDLEGHTGARLLQRSARAMRLTEQGRALYDATSGALSTVDAAIEGVRSGAGSIGGTLHVHGSVCIGERHLNRIVLDFQRMHPEVRVCLTLEDRAVDLIEEDIDLSVRVGQPETQNFVARHGTPRSRRDLAGRGLIVTTTILSRHGTITLCRGTSMVEVPAHAVLTTNNPQVLIGALEAGRAIGIAQLQLVADHLASKRLVRVLPRDEVKATELFLTYPSSKFLRPVVRAFIDFMVPALRSVDGIIR